MAAAGSADAAQDARLLAHQWQCWSGRGWRSAKRGYVIGHEGRTVRSVLIVDDDLDFAESLADRLRRKGYAACCVDTPERAIAALREPPDGGAA